MRKPLLPDALWERIEPLLPVAERRSRYPGRKRLEPRKVLTGVLFVFKTGLAWDDLPTECGWGCGKTCRRALEEWRLAGVWDALHALLLAELDWAGRIDWSRALVDGGSVRAPCGGEHTGPNPTDRRKSGSKHHVITDGNGVPLACTLTGANRHDVTQLVPLVDAVPPVKGKRGRPRRRPEAVQGDRAYDSKEHRAELRRRHIRPILARRRTAHGSGLGRTRWPVERTISWLHDFGRMRLRRDILPEIHKAWMALACSLICFHLLC